MVRVLSAIDYHTLQRPGPLEDMLEYYGCDGFAVISFYSSHEAPLVWKPSHGLLTLKLDDVLGPLPGVVAADEVSMQRVFDFFVRVMGEPKKTLLICQCEGGRSRSAAVGTFFWKRLVDCGANVWLNPVLLSEGITDPWQTFAYENPALCPNRLMLDLLEAV